MNHQLLDAGLRRLCALRQPGETFTLEVIARECNTSRERIRQIECAALDKLARNKLARALYAALFDMHPIKKESYLQRQARLRRDRTKHQQMTARNPATA